MGSLEAGSSLTGQQAWWEQPRLAPAVPTRGWRCPQAAPISSNGNGACGEQETVMSLCSSTNEVPRVVSSADAQEMGSSAVNGSVLIYTLGRAGPCSFKSGRAVPAALVFNSSVLSQPSPPLQSINHKLY